MNGMEKLLQDELNRLVDRIAVSTGEGTVAETAGHRAELRTRLEESEARLTALRAMLLESYAEWERAIEACENLWALAGLQGEVPAGASQLRAA